MNEKPWDAQLAYHAVYPLRHTFLTPNHLTLLRLLSGLMAAALLASGNYALANAGAFCFVVSNFLDHADGELARLTGKSSTTGHYFDLACDAGVNTLLFAGISIGLMGGPLGHWTLLMGIAAGLAVSVIFITRARIEKITGKARARQPNIGWFEAEDVLYLLPVITLMDWRVPFLVLACIGAPAYAIQVLFEYRRIRQAGL